VPGTISTLIKTYNQIVRLYDKLTITIGTAYSWKTSLVCCH